MCTKCSFDHWYVTILRHSYALQYAIFENSGHAKKNVTERMKARLMRTDEEPASCCEKGMVSVVLLLNVSLCEEDISGVSFHVFSLPLDS